MKNIHCVNMLDEFLNAKTIKLIPFLEHHKIDKSYYYDPEKESSIITSEDMQYYTYLAVQLSVKLSDEVNKTLIIMQTWQFINDLYTLDKDCEYGFGNLIEMLLDKFSC